MGSSFTTGPDSNLGMKSPLRRTKALPEHMLKNNYEVEVLINGKAAKEFAHKGKVYIEGREGTRFSIRMKNNSYSRKLFVPTIDGLSVMNGEEGSYSSSGYIVKGHDSITIDGWRTSDSEVAEFYFSTPEGSYRKKMDKGNNLGIIGVAVFDEKVQPISWNGQGLSQVYPAYQQPQWNGINPFPNVTYSNTTTPGSVLGSINTINTTDADGGKYSVTTSSAGSSSVEFPMNQAANAIFSYNTTADTSSVMLYTASAGSAQTQALGTGWGEYRNSDVVSVEFERDLKPSTVFEIHYNSRYELERAGVIFQKPPLYVSVKPQAFPGQYCKPPKTCSCDGINQGCTDPGCASRN